MILKFFLKNKYLPFILILILGIYFRCVNLDQRLYWYDESFTLLRISGYTEAELIQELFTGQAISSEALKKYQQPSSAKTLIDTIKGLAIEEPQHPPLYYILSRFWVQLQGSSVVSIRSFSVIISLLTFLGLYWLCAELFPNQGALPGWLTICLVAISPFQVYYSQEARSYSLWILTIVLSSASLLHALHHSKTMSWIGYGFTLTLSFYTFLFSGLVAISHGLYILTLERFRWTQTVVYYSLASVLSLLLFSPWIFVLINHYQSLIKTTHWTGSVILSFPQLCQHWISNLRHLIYSFDTPAPLQIILITISVGLMAVSGYFIATKTSRFTSLFLLTLTLTSAIILISHDLIKGGRLSIIPRYFMASCLGIYLSLSYYLFVIIYHGNHVQKVVGTFLSSVVIGLGVISHWTTVDQAVFRYHFISQENLEIAHILNQHPHSILLSNSFFSNPGDLLSLSHSLQDHVRLILFVEPEIPQVDVHSADVFLFRSIDDQKHKPKLALEQFYQIHPVDNLKMLWQLTNK